MSQQLKSILSIQIEKQNWNLVHAFRFARCKSNIVFLRWCKVNKVIPSGLCVSNKLKSTLSGFSNKAEDLLKKHSWQWLKCCIDGTYRKLKELQHRACFPLNYDDQIIYHTYLYNLRSVKRHKKNKFSDSSNMVVERREEPIGFKNLSSANFSQKEVLILNKGPAYIPPHLRKADKIEVIKDKCEIQTCFDRLSHKDATLASSPNVSEFLSSCTRLNSTYRKQTYDVKDRQIINTIKSIKRKAAEFPIVPSDKTKRLIAMNSNSYQVLLKKSLNPADKNVRQVLPSTVQKRMNDKFSSIANNYVSLPAVFSRLSSLKVTEPLPSQPYVLPKDHKEGELKGRPIISSCNSAVKKLAVFLCELLNPLVKSFISAHLESTIQFKNLIDGKKMESNWKFFSLDVTNLYGSIPLDTPNTGLIDVVTTFFDEHKMDSIMHHLHTEDFRVLLSLCLKEDTYILDSNLKKQVSGIAMGNPAAPPLAIIYMGYIENQLLQGGSSILFYKRYIDDCFIISDVSPQVILNQANNINPSIQFTLEESTNNSLAFLDTLVEKDEYKLSCRLYSKPVHSGTCLHFSSYCPSNRKTSLVQSEFQRAIRNSSEQHTASSTTIISQRLHNNGYSQSFLSNVQRKSQQPREETEEPLTEKNIAIKYLHF